MSATTITILIVVFLALGVISFMWKLSKMLLIPLRIAIFIAILWVIWRAVATRDNVAALQRQVEKSALPELTAGGVKQLTDLKPSVPAAAAKPAETAPAAKPVAPVAAAKPAETAPAVRKNVPVQRPQVVRDDIRPAARPTPVVVNAPETPRAPAPSSSAAVPENSAPKKENEVKKQDLFDKIDKMHIDI